MTTPYQRTLITTRDAFRDALRQAFATLADASCREVWMCDENFSDWPLNEPETIEALTRWSKPHRKLTMIARDWSSMARLHPRWVNYRVTWSHVVDCRSPDADLEGALPVLLLADRTWVVRLAHPQNFRGVATDEPVEFVPSRELIDAIAQRSEAAFPATHLGL